MSEFVGFIGLGMMGLPMSKQLIKSGFKIVAYDVNPEALRDAKEVGAYETSSPREVAQRCNQIITMLPNSEIVEKVVLGPDGIVHGMRSGAVLIDMTTGYPPSTLKIAQTLSAKGIEMLDAPVSGGVLRAKEGTLSIMVGGNYKIVERCRPLFQAMGTDLFYMGKVGSGHTMKAVNNTLSACLVAATGEALTLATKAGLTPHTVIDVLQASTGRNYATEVKFPKFVLTRTFDDGFRIELLLKDLDIAGRLAREVGVPTFINSTIQQIFGFALSQGYGDKGHTGVVQLLEEWAKVKIEE